MTVIGELQGAIDGSCDMLGREGTILVQAVDHTVEVPTDEGGVATGRRVHRPLTITKEIDKSTPMLLQALCSNERLSELTLDWYRVDETGGQELYFSIRMKSAYVTRVHPWLPNALDKDVAGLRHMEDVSFVYESIRWTWEPDGIEFEDSWGESF
jgi:type VI secretion system secreted protein Hcp